MASLENRTGYRSISFRFGGKKLNRSLKTRDRRAAEELKKAVENTLWKVEQGLLSLPENADVISFFLSGGGVRNVSICLRHLRVEISVVWTRFASSFA